MRRTFALYSPSLVLLAWAVAWGAGATSDAVMVAALVAEAGAIYLHVKEQIRRYSQRGELAPVPEPAGVKRRRVEDRRRSYRDVWLVAISLLLLWSAFQGQETADNAEKAAKDAKRGARVNRMAILQSCVLTKARVQDNVTRLEQAVDYANDPQNRRDNPGLVRTVRAVSIPFNVRQIRVDLKNYPTSCGPPPPLPDKVVPLFRRRR